jgi:hypothetical protein
MRAALATAELDDADLRQIYDELKSIKTDALDPAGRLAMAITRSQTETSMRYALATAELDEADHHVDGQRNASGEIFCLPGVE